MMSHQISLTLIKHLIPDILFFVIKGILIGCCEVKRPSDENDDLDGIVNKLQNQIVNYLLQLKYTHGIEYPISIITTNREWKLCCLDNSYDYLIFESPSELFESPPTSQSPSQEKLHYILQKFINTTTRI